MISFYDFQSSQISLKKNTTVNSSSLNTAALQNCITKTDVPDYPKPYRGKVRDVYKLGSNKLGIVASDRISAFDHIMKQAIPYKGQVLNSLAAFAFDKVDDIVNTHIIDVPHPNVTIAKKCDPIPIEVVIRACLTGHAARVYKSGNRTLCGVVLPDGLVENQKFEEPILTPATKAEEGHDQDISEREILDQGIVDEDIWREVRKKAFQVFERGQQIAHKQGLILVDTKYEFGLHNGEVTLIDEVHTADSSRYFYADGYEERLKRGKPQKQLSKEFLREWLMDHNFQGKEGQTLPDLPDDFRIKVYNRYTELYEKLTGNSFEPTPIDMDSFNNELKEIFKRYL